MAAPRNNNNAAALAILLLGLILAALTPGASAASRPSTACAAAFEGCLKCGKTTDGTADTCTKCRPNSTWDEETSACRCNDSFGTLSKAVFDAWAACDENNSKPCPPKRYSSSIASKCVPCDKYAATSVDGECLATLTISLQQTKLTIVNKIKDPRPKSLLWNPSWLIVNIGQCPVACAVDWDYARGTTLKPGQTTSKQGSNAGATDVVAVVTFCRTPPLGNFLKCSNSDTVRIEAGNPYVGYPWISIGAASHNFYERESWSVNEGGHAFRAMRGPDRGAAKDMTVEILS
jgi:hypothetical protein